MNTQKVQMKEQEINLWDFMAEVLTYWRVAVFVALFGGILLAGFSYVQSVRVAKAQQEQQREAELAKQNSAEGDKEQVVDTGSNWLQAQLTEAQIDNVNCALTYEELYKKKQNYWENSILMQMDSAHVQQAELTFWVQADNLEYAYNIEKMYEDLLEDSAFYNYVEGECGIEADVSELITLEKSSYSLKEGSDTVRVKIWHSDKDTCERMAETVVSYVSKKQSELTQTVYAHRIELINQSLGEITSAEVMRAQQECMLDIVNLRRNYVTFKAAFSAEESAYFNYLVKGSVGGNPNGEKSNQKDTSKEPENNGTETGEAIIITSPHVSLKYTLAGIVLFVFGYVFVIFLKYILNNKIRAIDNYQDIYGISQLGLITDSNDKKRFMGFVDKWILKLRFRGQRRFSPQEAENLAIVAVKIAAKRQNVQKICLVGCNLSKRVEAFGNQLKTNLKQEAVEVEILNNVLYDAGAMERLCNAQAVVLVETAQSTLYEEILRELQLFEQQDIAILGGVIVE